MTKQEKIEAIRLKCIEANPSILDLKFGCLIKTGNKKIRIVKKFFDEDSIKIYSTNIKNREVLHLDDERARRKHDSPEFELRDSQCNTIDDNIKIIGRPITLCDIMVAIDEMRINEPTTVENGYISLFFDKVDYFKWNLKQNRLQDQEIETINYLFGMLCQEKGTL